MGIEPRARDDRRARAANGSSWTASRCGARKWTVTTTAWWKLTADVLEIGGGMLKENWRTVPVALLSPVAPHFTLVAQTRDIAYAPRYSRISGG